ncbi:MAG TPA: LD-carboxypeptidase [Candidatus Gastranaerophilaceae bacterium]|nr:LD-carboxypeptidase [Candidatus Gastranaerophilaceae bacterium]HPT42094.1 LD-carboxypeptidase [Candidatus Gastranaerophilaceae bacterium]
MNLIKPEKLKKGDTIGFIALSGTVEKEENIYRAKEYFEKKGYKVVFSKNIFDKNRYLAGKDEDKIKELHRFFKDKNINAILCARGGYGTIRLLDKIDFELIKNNPKIFAGYSDTSALQAMILKKTGLITFYSPMAQSDFGVEEVSKVTEKSFFETLQNVGELMLLPERKEAKVYFEGEAKGVLFGGNLATLVSLCGLDFIPSEKFILFIEDLNEPVYKIDKMMTQLLNIEKFKKNISGIILGDFLKNGNKKYFDELFFEIGEKIKKPILSGFKITHAHEKITLPYGAQGYLSTKSKKLIFKSF